WQNMFGRYLDDAGVAVTKASTFEEALSILGREFFHIALVDMSLIGDANRDGIKILETLYADPREGTSGVLITAYGSPAEGADAARIGAFHVLNKANLKDYAAV